MDLRLIKKLLERGKAKIIIVEDGKPTMVISSIDEYLDQVDIKEGSDNPGIKEQQSESKETRKEEETILLPEEQKHEESKGLTIDDLPL
ncbi:hypothetical protein J7J24_01020 [bacterium]|nr:hypothetical protein [bacterium]